jgi:hypothetical protein
MAAKEDYRALLGELGISAAEAGRLLGVSERSSRKWADGQRRVNPIAYRFLLWLRITRADLDAVHRSLVGTLPAARRTRRRRTPGAPVGRPT